MEYNTAPTGDLDRNATCQVMEQKETPTGLKDEPCQRPVPPHYAGLCESVLIRQIEYSFVTLSIVDLVSSLVTWCIHWCPGVLIGNLVY